jgi:uncharacterized membrane protein YkvA (DUF1232 family)
VKPLSRLWVTKTRQNLAVSWEIVIGIVVSLVVVWLAFIALLWVMRPRDARLRDLVRIVPDVLVLVRRLIGDQSAPMGVRFALAGLLLWLLNPIDLIPEFIPVLGPLDDVVVAVIVLRYTRRRLGDTELRTRWPGTDHGYALLMSVLGRPPSN